jgi:hypothetical protein
MKKEAIKALRESKGRERAEKERGGEQEIAIYVLRAQSDTLSIDNVHLRSQHTRFFLQSQLSGLQINIYLE